MFSLPRKSAISVGVALSLGISVGGMHQSAFAQSPPATATQTYRIDIPSQPLGSALQAITSQTGAQVQLPAVGSNATSTAVNGNYSIDDALKTLLQGTNLTAAKNSNGMYVIGSGVTAQATGDKQTLAPVVVTAQAPMKAALLPKTYYGGQVATGSRLGMLGNVDVMDTPFSTTAYTSELIKNQQARSIIDVLANEPSSHAAGPWHVDNFFIRGFSITRREIGFDGLYGIASAEGVLLEGLERVEVLRGPSTLVNGTSPAGAAGGAINLVPKRASDAPITNLTTSFLSDGNLGTHLDFGRRFGVDNSLGIRLNVAHRDGDGPTDKESQKASVFTVGLDYRGDHLRLSTDFGTSQQRVDGAKGNFFFSPTATALPGAPAGKSSVWQPWEYQDKEHTFAVVHGEYDINENLSVGAAAGSSKSRRDQISLFHTIVKANGDTSAATSGFSGVTDTNSAEISLRGRFNTGTVGHQISLAATSYNYEYSEYTMPALGTFASNIFNPAVIGQPTGANLNGPRTKRQETKLTSYALADTLSLLDKRLLLTLGVRQQVVVDSRFNATTGVRLNPYDKSALTPAVAAVYKATDKLSIYGNYVEALSQGPIAPTTAVNPGEVFAPFVSKQAEIGAKLDIGTMTGSVSLFQIQQPSGILNASNRFTVDGEQRNRGVELQLFGEAARGVRVLGGIAWTDGKLTKTQGGLTDGKQAAGVPEWQLKIGGEYDLPQVPGLTATGRVLYTSSQPLVVENTVRLPSWSRLDLGARYSTKINGLPVVFRGTVENVTNANYWDSAVAFRVPTYAAPRTFLLSASIDF